jgi:preprotein translocase subunit SecF
MIAHLQRRREGVMFKVSVLVWIMLGTVLAGVSLIVVLMVPSFAADAIRNIPYAVAVGFALAIPLSYLVARQIRGGQGLRNV